MTQLCARPSTWRAHSACASRPRASRPAPRSTASRASAATTRRASSSATRPRPRTCARGRSWYRCGGPVLKAFAAAALALLSIGTATAAAASDPSYIVVLRDGSSSAQTVERSAGVSAQHRYGAALNGFSARLSGPQLARVKARSEVAYVVPDTTFEAASMQPLAAGETAPPGIRRVQAASLTEAHVA